LKDENYLTISTPTKQNPSNNTNKQSKIWKGFRGFHAKSKKQKSQTSPRTVLHDPSVFNIGCFETDGDTSYEVSFLSENSLASPGKQETYFPGRSKSPSKLNTSSSSSSSFTSLLLRRKSSSSSTYNPNQKSDVFDDYYKKEETPQKKVFDEYYKKEEDFNIPIRSLRNVSTPNKQKQEEEEEQEEVDENKNEVESPSLSEKQESNQAMDPFLQEVIQESISQEESLQTNTLDSNPTIESTSSPNATSKPTTPTTTTPSTIPSTSNPNDTKPASFVDSIPCQPLAQIFACATDLTEFEKMLFGDDLLPGCSNHCEPILKDNKGVSHNSVSYENRDQGEMEEYFRDVQSGNDNPSHMVDTFLSVSNTYLEETFFLVFMLRCSNSNTLFFVLYFQQATKRGLPLVYFQPKNAQESEWDAHDITMYVTPGRRDEQVSVPPKLMWVARDNASHSNTNVYQHLDLNEIDSILMPEDHNSDEEENNVEEEENEMEQVCFSLITKAGTVYIFEALDDRQRNFVVESLQIVVSRLAFV